MSRAPTVRLVALDMAGTTVDDGSAVESAFRAALDSEGLDHVDVGEDPGEYVRRTMGRSKIEVFTHLAGGNADRARRANVVFESTFDRAVADGLVRPLPGAVEAMGALRSAGVRVALTTGFSPATRDGIVDALGWRDRVDLLVSPADAGRGRPHPDMVLTAVLRLGIDDVAEVAVAGDTTSDLLAGSRAGASVVAGVLTGAHTREELAAVPHTHLLASVADLPGVVLG